MDYENKDFDEMILHLQDVVKRNGKNSRSGESAARTIRKIRTMKRIKTEAIRLNERLKKDYGHIHIEA
jgi:hypothetical protein